MLPEILKPIPSHESLIGWIKLTQANERQVERSPWFETC